MSKTLSLTVPMDNETLVKTADYLLALAGEQRAISMVTTTVENGEATTAPTPEAAPAPSAPAPAPTAPQAAPAPPTLGDSTDYDASDDLDAEGIPYDERIHSGTKGKNKDGTWKKRRGVDKKLYNKVMAELTANANADAPAPTAPPAPAPQAAPPAPAAPTAPPAPALSPTPEPLPNMTFGQLSMEIMPMFQSGQLTIEKLDEIAHAIGLNEWSELGGHPEKVNDAFKHIQAIRGQG